LSLCVEQDALMSPNPRGKLEDLAVVVCVSSCLKLVNSLLKMIQAQLKLVMGFLKGSEISTG